MQRLDVFGWPVEPGEKPFEREKRWGDETYTTDELLEFFMSRLWNMSPVPLYPTDEKIYKGVIVSIAASGPRTWHDRIFNLSILRFDADRFGNMYQISFFEDLFEDPRRDIDPERLQLMRISEDQLLDAKIDEELINRIVTAADFVVMYDASNRRDMLETRFPIFKSKPFVCSKHDIFWPVWRLVPPGHPPLESYSTAHGSSFLIDRPSDEVLLTAWLLSRPNPRLAEETRFYTELPRLLVEVIELSKVMTARIFLEDGRTHRVNLLRNEGFTWDQAGKVWYKDVPLIERYPNIHRVQELFFDGDHVPIAWMPIDRVRAHTRDAIFLPTVEEEEEALLALPVPTLLHSLEDTLRIVPHPKQVLLLRSVDEPSPLSLCQISQYLTLHDDW